MDKDTKEGLRLFGIFIGCGVSAVCIIIFIWWCAYLLVQETDRWNDRREYENRSDIAVNDSVENVIRQYKIDSMKLKLHIIQAEKSK